MGELSAKADEWFNALVENHWDDSFTLGRNKLSTQKRLIVRLLAGLMIPPYYVPENSSIKSPAAGVPEEVINFFTLKETDSRF